MTEEGRERAPSFEPVDPANYDPELDPAAPVPCEVCGGKMQYTGTCKLRCLHCGYTRDCSDP